MQHYPRTLNTQTGVALITSLIFLIVLTLIGVTAMQTATLEERMAGNMRDFNLAFQASEAALREGERFLQAATLPDFDGTNGLYQPAELNTSPVWEQDAIWESAALVYSETLYEVAEPPMYIIEQLATVAETGDSLASDRPVQESTLYRITARGVGGSPDTMVMLQTIYKR